MLTVVGTARSRAMRVLWTLEELGIAYEHRPEPPRSEAVRTLSPLGKIPVLIDGDAVITDSTAIITWLADRHGALSYPAGSVHRARQDALTMFALGELDATLWMAARHSFVLPEEHRQPAIKESLRWEFRRAIGQLGDLLGDGQFLTGDTLRIPDIVVGHCLAWARLARFPIEDAAVAEYGERLRSRPGYKRAAARD